MIQFHLLLENWYLFSESHLSDFSHLSDPTEIMKKYCRKFWVRRASPALSDRLSAAPPQGRTVRSGCPINMATMCPWSQSIFFEMVFPPQFSTANRCHRARPLRHSSSTAPLDTRSGCSQSFQALCCPLSFRLIGSSSLLPSFVSFDRFKLFAALIRFV